MSDYSKDVRDERIATLAAEVEQLRKERAINDPSEIHAANVQADLTESRAEKAGAEVERLKDLIRWAHDTLYEINLSNYDHDEVCKLNGASVEVILGLAPTLGERHGKSKDWWLARAKAEEGNAIGAVGGAARAEASAAVKVLEALHLTEYEIQVLLGCSISGCRMSPDRVFSLPMAWHRLHAMGLIDRTDGLAIITKAGRVAVSAILSALTTQLAAPSEDHEPSGQKPGHQSRTKSESAPADAKAGETSPDTLTDALVAALDIARGGMLWKCRSWEAPQIWANLKRRGWVEKDPSSGHWRLTTAGRAALEEQGDG